MKRKLEAHLRYLELDNHIFIDQRAGAELSMLMECSLSTFYLNLLRLQKDKTLTKVRQNVYRLEVA